MDLPHEEGQVRKSILEKVALCAKVKEVRERQKVNGSTLESTEAWFLALKERKKLRKKFERCLSRRLLGSLKSMRVGDAAEIETDSSEDEENTRTAGDQAEDPPNNSPRDELITEKETAPESTTKSDFILGSSLFSNIHLTFEHPTVSGGDHFQLHIPSSREGGTLTMVGDHTMVAFGGRFPYDDSVLLPRTILPRSSKAPYYYCDQVYTLDLRKFCWDMPVCSGTGPRGRCDHAAVFVEPDLLIIHGGRTKQGIVLQDTFCLNTKTWLWSELSRGSCAAHDRKRFPRPRFWHGMTVSNRKVLLFGGKNESEDVFDDLWAMDLDEKQPTWQSPLLFGDPPCGRFGHCMLSLPADQILVVGGWKVHTEYMNSPLPNPLIDIHVLETTTWIWRRPHLGKHFNELSIPVDRCLFQCFRSESALVVFGGYHFHEATHKADPRNELKRWIGISDPYVHILDLPTMIWKRHTVAQRESIPSTTLPPMCRYGAVDNTTFSTTERVTKFLTFQHNKNKTEDSLLIVGFRRDVCTQ